MLGGRRTTRSSSVGGANGLLRATSNTGLLSAIVATTGSRWVLTERVSFVGSDFRQRRRLTQELARGYTQAIIARVDFNDRARPRLDDRCRRRGTSAIGSNQILRDFVTVGGGTRDPRAASTRESRR